MGAPECRGRGAEGQQPPKWEGGGHWDLSRSYRSTQFLLRWCTYLWWLGGTGEEKKAQSQHTTKAGPMNMK